jgi:hypothetical protein
MVARVAAIPVGEARPLPAEMAGTGPAMTRMGRLGWTAGDSFAASAFARAAQMGDKQATSDRAQSLLRDQRKLAASELTDSRVK